MDQANDSPKDQQVPDADGYYDEDTGSEEIDLSFLDEKEAETEKDK
jgi:hypothetical protein